MVGGEWTVAPIEASKPPLTLRNLLKTGLPLIVNPYKKFKYISCQYEKKQKCTHQIRSPAFIPTPMTSDAGELDIWGVKLAALLSRYFHTVGTHCTPTIRHITFPNFTPI
jgi:hypothetical protein